jgi:2-hydroxychromene-2-carboxylate isomerase
VTTVHFWFDPGCPFTWATSRWLVEVAGARNLDVRWHPMSLAILNADKDIPQRYREILAASGRRVRIVAAVQATAGNAAVGDFYTAFGRLVHQAGEAGDRAVSSALETAGLPPSLAAAMDDASYDAAIQTSHDEGQQRVGMDSGSPILAIDEGPGFFGPVVAPTPQGDDALRLYDALVAVSGVPQFSEVKRARRSIA